MYPLYKCEVVDIEGRTIEEIDDLISVQAARAFNTDGAATLVLPNYYKRDIFRLHTRMKLWRYDYRGQPLNFGDTIWFLKKIDNSISDHTYTLTWVDAFAMFGTRIVAYTSLTPYADKTLEELALVTYNDTLRIDNMMRAYMRENFGSLALDAERLNTHISIERNKNLGPYGEKQAAWQDLDSVLSDLAKQSAANGLPLFYDLLPGDDGDFTFRIWSRVRGIDRGSGAAVNLTLNDTDGMIDDIHDIEDYSDVATVCYALGYDSGPSQVIESVTSPLLLRNDPFSRIEMTINAADSDVASVLQADARAALNGRRPKHMVTARVVENNALRYGDLVYGDLLSVEVAGRKYDVAVNAVSVRWDSDGEDLDIHLLGEEAIGVILSGGPADPGITIPGAVNTRPVVDAGDDQDAGFGDVVTLTGSAVDDGLPSPPALLTYAWSQVSGPGTATFLDATDATTTVEFDTEGVYVLRLSASDSLLNGEDDITITVTEFLPTPPNPDIIRRSMERVGGMSQYHWYRTDDFQTREIEGGPTWTRHDVAVDDTEIILSYIVNPFSAGYLTGTGEVNAFVATGADILKVTDLFGTIGRSTLLTFPTALSSAAHWRTIAASFGAYFDEGLNPWLVCISYYASTGGHTGTWATHSMDGGATWSAEVQVSAHYDTALAIAAPVAVYTSPRTPGFAITVAYKETDVPAESEIFLSYDWGATWTAASAIVEDPAEPWPIVDPGGGGGGGSVHSYSESTSGTVTDDPEFTIFAPVGAVQMRVKVSYSSFVNKDGGFSSAAGGPGAAPEGLASVHVEDESSYGTDSYNEANGGSKLYRVETPDADGTAGITLSFFTGVNSVGGLFISMTGILRAWVTEITLDDDTVYTPPILPAIGTEHGQGGTIHVPWEGNEDEAVLFVGGVDRATNRLLTTKSLVGATMENASPNDGSRDFGPYTGPFGIRAYDSGRSYMLLGGRGNGSSADAGDDLVGYWLSQSAGGTWQELIAPVDESNALYGLQTAFSGTDPSVLYAWGGWTDGALAAIYHSRDLGQNMDSRQGNLATLEDGSFGGHIAFIGIAGGPIDDEPEPPEGDESIYANPAYFYGDMKAFVVWDDVDVLRTMDIQEASTVWAHIGTGITGSIKDGKWVVIDENTLGMWLLTTTGVFWCADILATTPSWSNVLPIATVQAADAAPAVGQTAVEFQCMAVYDLEPGYCIVATAPIDSAVNPEAYLHSYTWHTHDYGANWTQIDMNGFTFTSGGGGGVTRCYYNAGNFAMDIFRKAPGTIWIIRNTSRTGTSTGSTAIFKSVDLGHTWTKELTIANWSTPSSEGALLAPWPYLNSPSYLTRDFGTSGGNLTMRVSLDQWATGTIVTPPANHGGAFGNHNVIQRLNRRATDENHVLGILLQTSPLSSGGPLFESYDQGATWNLLVTNAELTNDYTTPKEWPLDPYQWVIIGNDGNGAAFGRIGLTLDNFETIEARLGNMASVLTGGNWNTGLGSGFALPKIAPNV